MGDTDTPRPTLVARNGRDAAAAIDTSAGLLVDAAAATPAAVGVEAAEGVLMWQLRRCRYSR